MSRLAEALSRQWIVREARLVKNISASRTGPDKKSDNRRLRDDKQNLHLARPTVLGMKPTIGGQTRRKHAKKRREALVKRARRSKSFLATEAIAAFVGGGKLAAR
jgi:hypothetical protein